MSQRRSSTRSTPCREYTVHEVGEGGRGPASWTGVPRDQQCDASRRDRRRDLDRQRRDHRGRYRRIFQVRRTAHPRRTCAARSQPSHARCRSWRARTRSMRRICCGMRSATRAELGCAREPRGLRQYARSTGSCRRSPGGGIDVTVEPFFEWADRAPAVRRRPAEDPGRALRRRPRALHRAQALHRQHRSRDDGLFRRRGRRREDLGRPCRPRDRRQGRGDPRGDLRAAGREARARPGELAAYRATILAGSAIRCSPTPCGGWGASRCASSRATSASSARPPKPPSAGSRRRTRGRDGRRARVRRPGG